MSFAFRIREMDDSDHEFVVRTWTRTNATVQTRASPAYYEKEQPKAIAEVLSFHPIVFGLVATPPDEPTLICGWGVFDDARRVVHYVFVKSAYRRCGVARALVEKALPGPEPRFHSHLPARVAGNRIALSPSAWRYNGYLFI